MRIRLDEKLTTLLGEIRALAPHEKVYLVGGAVRDLVLEREVTDLDFVLASGSVSLAKAVKKHFGGVWYSLDDLHQTARVILAQGTAQEQIFDFTSFIGGNLLEDLRQRDFTINAMAIDLDDLGKVIDPLNGREDLTERRLRLGNPCSLESDPLRVLRGVRLIRSHNLGYEPQIIHAMRVATTSLANVSGERIRDELLKCLAQPDFCRTLQLFQEFGIYNSLSVLIYKNSDLANMRSLAAQANPSDGFERVEGFLPQEKEQFLSNLEQLVIQIQTTEAAEQFEVVFSPKEAVLLNGSGLDRQLTEELQGGRSRKQLLILTSFFFDASPLEKLAEGLAHTFMLGQKEYKHLERLLVGYNKISKLTQQESLQRINLYRYFKEVGSAGLEAALLHLASPISARTKTISNKVIETWFTQQSETVNPPRLVDGDDLQTKLGIAPGSVLGEALEAIREAQIEGTVQTTQDALEHVRALIKQKDTDENKNK